MKRRSLAVALSLSLGLSCGERAPAGDAKPSSGATVKAVAETGLGEVTLGADARRRLGIETHPLEATSAPRQRLLGGEVVVALGDAPGATSIYSLVPPRSAGELERVADLQLTADGAVELARIDREAAREALARSEALLESRAASGRSVEEARARLALSEAALRGALRRRSLLGVPVFDAVGSDRVWVRVAVYAGETRRLDFEAPASLRPLGAPAGESAGTLRPVRGPVSAGGAAAVVDLYYTPTQGGPALRPGERVTVLVPFREQEAALRAPLSAVIRDAQGGAWVYEETGPDTFVRRHVTVRDAQAGWATLSDGPPAGSKVVSAGAAELFGTELGFAR